MTTKLRARRVQSPAQLAVLLCIAAAPLHAQRVPGWLPSDDWSRVVLARMHALGSGPFDATPLQLPLARIMTISDSAHTADPLLQRLARERVNGAHRRLHIEAGPAFQQRADALATGRFALDRTWIEPAPLPDYVAVGGLVHARLRAHDRVSLTAHVSGHGADWDATHATIDIAIRDVQLWAGRRALGYAIGETGSLVLTRLPRLTGAGINVHERRVPVFGSAGGELYAGRVADNGHVRDPWLIGMRVHITPHPRFDLGATRIAQFGRTGSQPLGVREVLNVLVSANLEPPFADDQVASFDVRWRPRLPIPVELYGEWGVHDIDPGVFIDVPAFTAGVRVPALPGMPGAAVTLEHTQISGSCCGNPPWYHHFEFAEGWTARREPLGHPLGGQGREWRMALHAFPATAVLQLDIAARTRGAENLYAPAREGESAVLTLRADVPATQRTALFFAFTGEKGNGWSTVRVQSHLRLRF